ncbi:MAG: hypothetical protein Q8Q04_03070 [archaeon]|nr:hypothetical protein [archaeon]
MERRRLYLLVVLLALLLLIVILYAVYFARPYLVNPNPGEEVCLSDGGEWKEFSDSCANTCSYERGGDRYCAQVLTFSCECGSGNCWDGKNCVPI